MYAYELVSACMCGCMCVQNRERGGDATFIVVAMLRGAPRLLLPLPHTHIRHGREGLSSKKIEQEKKISGIQTREADIQTDRSAGVRRE